MKLSTICSIYHISHEVIFIIMGYLYVIFCNVDFNSEQIAIQILLGLGSAFIGTITFLIMPIIFIAISYFRFGIFIIIFMLPENLEYWIEISIISLYGFFNLFSWYIANKENKSVTLIG